MKSQTIVTLAAAVVLPFAMLAHADDTAMFGPLMPCWIARMPVEVSGMK